jgi:N-acetylglucosamine kinase-like BadF-type ATPase
MNAVLGVDAGGTKTVAVVARQDGAVLGVGRAGSANFQGCGVGGAAGQIRRAVEEAARQAGIRPSEFAAVCYGVSGADRPKDFTTIRAFLEPIAPCKALRLENDTIIALRAGTKDGEGIALIAGTGSNAIGRTKAGIRLQVGGLGRLSGDYGSAFQIAEAAIVAAMKGQDGRGPATALTRKFIEKLKLDKIEDIVEFFFYDAPRQPIDLGTLAPLVLQVAGEGDEVAREVLREAGRNVARAVKVILDRLFPGQKRVTVVFGGSVFQKGISPVMIETVMEETRKTNPGARFVLLEAQPVLGAVNFAFDDLRWPVTAAVFKTLRDSYQARTGEKS